MSFPQNISALDDGHLQLQLQVTQARITAVSRQRPTAFLWNVSIMAVCVIVLWRFHSGLALLSWLGLNALFCLWRIIDWWRTREMQPKNLDEANRWLKRIAFASSFGGLIWGVGAYAFIDVANIGVLVFFLLTLLSVANGGVISYAAYFPAGISFAVPIAILAALRLLTVDLDYAPALSIGSLVVLGFMFAVGRNYAAAVTSALTLNIENAALVDEANRQRLAAEQANTDKSRFFAAVSHDLRQPLYAMGLVLETLGERLQSTEQRKLYSDLGRMHDAITEMFNAVMDISQLDSASVQVNIVDSELNSLVSNLISEFTPSAEQKSLELVFNSDKYWGRVDPVLVSRVLRNLISNSIKFSDTGRIIVEIENRGDTILLTVADEGCGIPEQELSHIFSEYYQLSNPTRDRTKGLGLGLAVVDRLCRLMEIPISVASTPGIGSRFTLHIMPGNPRAVREHKETDAVRAFGGLHVLVIDDDEDIRNSLDNLLTDHKCMVTIANSAQTALAKQSERTRPIDILLCDYRLGPNTTGFEEIISIRDAIDAELPALLITGDTNPDIIARADMMGLRVLLKPIKSADLFKAIIEAV